MTEWIMLFALGFSTAGLIAAVVAPLLWRRSAELTAKRIKGSIPVSLSEVQADKDRMRAEFAMTARRLEMSIADLKKKAHERLIEINKREDVAQRLKAAIANHKRTEAELHSKIETLESHIRRLERERADQKTELERISAKDLSRETAVAERDRQLSEATALADARRVEIAALKTQVEKFKGVLEERDQTLARVNELQQSLTKRVAELERELQDREAVVAEKRLEVGRLATELAALSDQKRELEEKLGASEEIVTGRRLVSEREMVAALEAERKDDALLRERLNDLAADVARLAAALDEEGELAEMIDDLPEGANGTAVDTARPRPATLAERMRALQQQASPTG